MNIYDSQFILYLLIVVRITSLLAVAPIFGHESVPAQLKIALVLFLALAFYPVASKDFNVIALSDFQLLGFALLVIKEVLVGILLGFAVSIIFYAALMAGEIIGFNMGLGFSQFFNPMVGQSTSFMGNFFYLIALLIFLLINGHHFLLQALQSSYSTVPVGGFSVNEFTYEEIIKLSRTLFIVGVKISAPALVALFLSNVVLGILSRVVPQMNVFIVGFPLQIGVGVVVLLIVSPLMVFVFKKLLLDFEESFLELVKVI